MSRPKTQRTDKKCENCGMVFQVTAGKAQQRKRFCSKLCSNRATTEIRAAAITGKVRVPVNICPCGQEVPRFDGASGKPTYIYRLYCSPECRSLYGKKKQADPANYVTFNCETCAVEVKRRKSFPGAHRFCSNECSARSNTQRRVVVGDVVLDSGWEALVWGLCSFWKIPIQRVDRATAVEWAEGHWYAPDFIVGGVAIEVKGLEDSDDSAKWAAWDGPLIILDRDALIQLLSNSIDRKAVMDCFAVELTKV